MGRGARRGGRGRRALALAFEVLGRDAGSYSATRARLSSAVSSDERGNVRRVVRVSRERSGEPRGSASRRGARRAPRRRAPASSLEPRGRSRARGVGAGSARREGRGTARTRRARGRAGGGTRRQTPRPPRTRRGRRLPPEPSTPSRRPERARRCARPDDRDCEASDRSALCDSRDRPRCGSRVRSPLETSSVPRASKARVASEHDMRG